MTTLKRAICLLIGSVWLVSPSYAAEERAAHKALYQEARAAQQAGQVDQALTLYQQAADLSREKWPSDAAVMHYLIGDIQLSRQAYADAERAYQEALTLRERAYGQQHGAVAVSLNALAGLYYQLGDYVRAQPLYERALSIDEAVQGSTHRNVAIDLNNLAELHRSLGNYKAAEPLYQRALEIDKIAFGLDHPRIAIRLSNLAELFREQGNYAAALDLLQRALLIDQQAVEKGEGDSTSLGIRFNNLGQLYRTLGDYAKAEPFYAQALAAWKTDPGEDSPLYAAGLNNQAWIAQALGQTQRAEQGYQAALAVLERAYGPNHPDIARHLNNLASLYTEQKRYAEAAPLYERALSLWEQQLGKDHPQVAMLLHNRAKLHRVQGHYPQAEADLQRAIVIAQAADQPELLWAVLDNQSQVLAAEQQPDAAILAGKQAVNTLQSLRLNIAQLDKELQRTFVNDKAPVYKRLAGLLIENGRLSEAQQIQTMLKEEEYYDFIRREDDSTKPARMMQASYSPQEKPWAERATNILGRVGKLGSRLKAFSQKTALKKEEQQQQNQLRGEVESSVQSYATYVQEMKQTFSSAQEEQTLAQLLTGGDQLLVSQAQAFQALRHKTPLTPAEQIEKDKLREIMNQARQNFNACIQEYKRQELFQDKNLDTLRALQGTLGELGHEAVLLHYLITPDKLRIILTTPTVQVCREAPVTETELDAKISQFRDLFKNPPDPRRRRQATQALQAQAKVLYDWLLGPVAKDLAQANAKTLMLSLDGRLRYLPIAALYDGQQYVAERYAVSLYTEASKDKLKDRPNPQWRLAGLGVTKAWRDFNPLPAVEQELHSIVAENNGPQSQGVIPGLIKLNEAFTARSFLDVLDQAYPVIHIASHFVFQPRTDQDAYLLLGDGEILSLAQIRAEYDFNQVDLLTLSACQTAMGSLSKGEEVEGFGALAQKQGAKSVIATLWPVDDQSTGLFMRHLYQVHTREAGITKVAALQKAQNAFIHTATSAAASGTAYPVDFEHPYYWGPFILMGNWL